jgi:hypothetical protein
VRAIVAPTLRMDQAERKAAREAMVSTSLHAWAEYANRNITREPFFGGGAQLNVVDLKLHMASAGSSAGKWTTSRRRSSRASPT